MWGYRRVWAYLKFRKKIIVSRNRIYRVMRENNLLVPETKFLKAKRENYPSKMRANQPNEIWGIDMTKIMIENFGWIYIVIIIDWYTKKIVGYTSRLQSKTDDWLDALNFAINVEFPDGVRGENLKLLSDNGSQPTSVKFIRDCANLGIEQIFTSYNNPKGNADTERFMRTLKEDCVWPYNFTRVADFEAKLDDWIKNYNEDFPHSSLGYKTPCEYFAEYKKNEASLPFQAFA